MEENIDHAKNVMLYTIGICCELRDFGVLECDFHMTNDGKAAYETLKSSGFRPTNDEMIDAANFMKVKLT